MPFYDYKCSECGEKFEIQKGMMEEIKSPSCPSCGKNRTMRVFSIPRVGRTENDLLNSYGTSGGSCNTCVDGVCSSCGVKK